MSQTLRSADVALMGRISSALELFRVEQCDETEWCAGQVGGLAQLTLADIKSEGGESMCFRTSICEPFLPAV